MRVPIDRLRIRTLDLNSKRIKLKEANESAKLKISEADILLKTKNKKGSEVGSEISTLKKGINLYNNNQCPTCTAPLDTQFHKKIKKQKTGELGRLEQLHTTLRGESKEVETSLGGMREMIKQILIKGGHLENSMLTYKDELLKLVESDGGEHDHLKDLIKDFKTKKGKKDQERLESAGQDNYLNVLENIMGEDGIKNLALRSILPSFNNHIMIMGKEMGIPFGIRFDDKFDCTLHHIGEEISPKTLSTGEKKKVDFVIIMALIKMIKMRFPSLNILFLDEIFSSIDADGVFHIINILHKTIQDIGLNTFVINHTVLPSEYFDKKLEITKGGGFSEFMIEKIN